VPRKCLQVVDSETSDFKRAVRVLLNDDTTAQKFNFKVQRIEGCADEYINKLQSELKIETQPPVPKEVLKFDVDFNSDNESFQVTLPKSVMADPAMPKNIPINIIFFLFWSSAEKNDGVSYMNVVYTLTLVSEINVKMDFR